MIGVKGFSELNEFIEKEYAKTDNNTKISDDTKAICRWLYIIIKTLVSILVAKDKEG